MWRPEVSSDVHLLLKHGTIRSLEHIPWGSNYTFCAELEYQGMTCQGVYKPRRGERPLWDFPQGTLYLREYAAYLASQALGWEFIPPTVIRSGPHGVGSMQLWVESEPPRSIHELQGPDRLDLARIAVFDFVTNNADRKGVHLLRDQESKIWGIDHGLCFNIPPKVRTVLYHFCGQPLPPAIHGELDAFRLDLGRVEGLNGAFLSIIESEEIDVFWRRVDWIRNLRGFPSLDPYSGAPWP